MTLITEATIEALELLEEGTLAQARITSAEGRTLFHATAARLALNHLAEPAGEEILTHRPLWRITDDGRAVLAFSRALKTRGPATVAEALNNPKETTP